MSNSERFLELKQKGWNNLNGEQREEYKKLQEAIEQGNGDAEPQPNNDDGKITVSREELDKIIAEQVAKQTVDSERRMESLERQVGMGDWKLAKKEKPMLRTARFKVWQKDSKSPEGLVVDWKHHKFEYDERSRAYDKDVYVYTIAYPEKDKKFEDWKKEEIEMPLEAFAAINKHETVTILKREVEVAERSHGQVRRTLKTKEGYTYLNPNMTGDEIVDLVETKEVATCIVEMADGTTFTISEDRLNA